VKDSIRDDDDPSGCEGGGSDAGSASGEELATSRDPGVHPGGKRDTLRELLRPVLAGRHRRVALLVVLALVGGLAEAAVLVLVARIGFAIAGGNPRIDVGIIGLELSMRTAIVLAGALTLVRFAFQALAAWYNSILTSDALVDVRKRMLRLFLAASWDVQAGERQGVLQELMTTYASQWTSVLGILLQGTVALCGLIALMAVALVVNGVAALSVLGAMGALALVLRPFRSVIRRRSSRTARANLEFATALTETASTAQEIRVFHVEDEVQRRMDNSVETHGRAFAAANFLSGILPGIYQTAALFLVVVALGVIQESDPSSLASLGAIVLIMVRSLSYGQLLQSVYQSLHNNAPYLERLEAQEREYKDAAVPRGGRSIEAVDEITFDHVTFGYEPGVSVLHDVSFRVPRGEIVGIVGPSGSGKSTLVQLLLRLRHPTEGEVLANGFDVDTFSLDDWYQRVTFVPQEPRLFAGSVADNIRFFRDGVSNQDIEEAARRAHLHDDVVGWHLGYDTPVGERGGQISGGQKQRLCIARALVGRPDLIVLDEPTSSLDAKSEALVRDTLRKLAPSMTVFVIAHRLSTLAICNRIMVLLAGRIEGFDEATVLEESNPFYREAIRLSGLR
jgi:ABC-type multidrug transport system fused ATPase/permease subunit